MIDEVKLACRVDGCAGDGEETVLELVNACYRSENGRRVRLRRPLRIGWDVQNSELSLAHFEMMTDIFDGVFIGELAQAQEGAATVVVAYGVTALGIHVNVAEVNVG